MNKFSLLSCRFHIKDKQKLVIQGCFEKNNEKKDFPFFSLDYTPLDYQMVEKAYVRNPAECAEGIYDKRYFFIINIPENYEEYKELRCFQYDEKIEGEAFHLDVKWISQQKNKRELCIDEVMCKGEQFYIRGWCACQKGTQPFATLRRNQNLSIGVMQRVERMDVERAFPDCTREEIFGFELTGSTKQKRIWIGVEDEYGSYYQEVKLSGSWLIGKIHFTREIMQKMKVYYQQFGLRMTIQRACDKLFGKKEENYEKWYAENVLAKRNLPGQKEAAFAHCPSYGIVVPLYRTPKQYLDAMISSVQEQTYPNWKLYLSDGSGADSPLRESLETYAEQDERIIVLSNEKQMRIVENTNVALEKVEEDFVVFMDHDDLIPPETLYECTKALNDKPETEVIYTDEDKISEDGTKYFQPHFKADFNLDLLRSQNYLSHLFIVRRELREKVGLLREEYEGSQDYDFILRCVEQTDHILHIPKVLYHWRAHMDSTAGNPESKEYAYIAGQKAIAAHYKRMHLDAEVTKMFWGVYRTKYQLRESPLVSVIIPNKDHAEDLKQCIESVEAKKKNIRLEYLVVENNSEEQETFLMYEELQRQYENLQVLYWDKSFNYSAINNFAEKKANGEYLLLLNNDTEVINDESLEELLTYCMREDVGIVGARLLYPDDTIQHAGVVLGLGGVAGHVFLGKKPDDLGYFGKIYCAQEYSAVTGACMMVKRSVYKEVGGLDEGFEVAFNDVDFCMRVRKAGYKVVYNPYALLYHYESKTRGMEDSEEKIQRFQREINLFVNRWNKELEEGDPFYNPNLTLSRGDFSLRV